MPNPTEILADPHWRTRANCKAVDPDIMQPNLDDITAVETAKAVCRGCPVTAECLTWAKKINDQYSVFGGQTPPERGTARCGITGVAHHRTCTRCKNDFTTLRSNQRKCHACAQSRHQAPAKPGPMVMAKTREIVAMRSEGASYATISRTIGCAVTSVRLAAEALGVNMALPQPTRDDFRLVA